MRILKGLIKMDSGSLIRLALCTILAVASTDLYAQCNTTLSKLLPDGSVNNEDRFGSALAISDQFMVIGADISDTLGIYYGGAAFVYEKTAAGWAYRALLTASDPDAYDFFGSKIAIDKDGSTIVILNRNYPFGGVYIFERPASGWTTMTETRKLTLSHYIDFDASVDISDDGSTIALISSELDPRYYLIDRPAGGWSNPVTETSFPGPQSGGTYGSGILLHGDYLYISAGNDDISIHVYKRSGVGYAHIARLSTTIFMGQIAYFGKYLTANDDLICVTGLVTEVGKAGFKFFVFKKNGEWTDATETAQHLIPGSENATRLYLPIQLISPTEMMSSLLVKEGEYHTGKLVHITASTPDWQNVSGEVIFQEAGLSSLSDFPLTLAWNGSDIVRTVSLKTEGLADRYAAVSLTRAGSFWGSQQYITLPRRNSSYVNFGSAVVKTKDALFAGAPYDGFSGKGAGAVFVYEKSGDEFVRVHSIHPSRRKIRPTGGSDAGFGYSLAVNENELAVAATSFRYAQGQYGKIFLYKRTTSSWTSATLYDSLVAPAELNLNHVGTALAMNDRFLFASAYNNFNDEHTNAVLVYEKVNDQWTFKQLLKLGRPLDKEWPTIRFSLHEDEILISSYASIDGGVGLFSKNDVTGQWEAKLSFSNGIFTAFGGDVKLLANHIFVGSPGYDYNGVLKSGAVFVYTKLPGQEWSEQSVTSAIIGASTPVEGGYFGSSIDVIGNTMAVGAPGKFLTEDYNVRTVPGNTYVIQAQDYYWQNTAQFLNLQGDRYALNERDHFGSDIGIDEEYFYIGARNENTSTGMFSGAVYYIPSPPVIFLYPPVCTGSDVIQLEAYPYNGTWSGPGVEDPSGKFNPSLAGPGISTLTYTTASCQFVGTIQIEVKSPIAVAQLSPADITICAQSEIRLQLESVPGTYDWYYKPEGSNDFIFMGSGGAERTISNPGEYFARINGLSCPASSAVFNVHTEENVQISVGPQGVVCAPNSTVSLVASHSTGTWEGTGVVGNNFKSGNLANGFYALLYHYTTPLGCQLTLKDSIKINVVKPILITRMPGDFCETGSAWLHVDPADPLLSYHWYFNATSGTGLAVIQKPLSPDVEVFEQGYYQAKATNSDHCTATSEVVNIGFDTDLPYELSLAENSNTQLCNQVEFTTSVQSREGTSFMWEHKNREADAYEVLNDLTTNEVVIEKSGYYRVSGDYGFCSFVSLPFQVEFITDSLFVPNVFSPNGDGYNQLFEVQSNLPIDQLKIFNRYGTEIYSSSNGKWDGGEAPSGTYYWILKYEGCDNRHAEAKGWVNLLR